MKFSDIKAASRPVDIKGVTNQRSFNTSSNVSFNELWAEKYRPKRFDDLIGNNAVIEKLKTWLKDWHDVVIKGNKKPVSFHGQNSENPNARATLLSGPPGIGKTTAAKLVCELMGYVPLEFNASDNRGKNAIEELAAGASQCHSLATFFQATGKGGASPGSALAAIQLKNSINAKKTCLIFDECDGLSGGDRGGSAAMIQLIKKSSVPVICICNDRMHTKVRSLANSCYDLRFIRTQKATIAKRMATIAKQEGLNVDQDALELLAENSRGDFRQILNSLQMVATTSKHIGALDMSNRLKTSNKDSVLSLSVFDAIKKLLSTDEWPSEGLNIIDQMNLFYVDYDLMGLFMQENYLSAAGRRAHSNLSESPEQLMQEVAAAAESFSDFDIISKSIIMNQNWSLLDHACTASTLVPSFLCRAPTAGRFEFPSTLGRISTLNKNKRLSEEVATYLKPYTTLNSSGMNKLAEHQLLVAKMTSPLTRTDIDQQTAVNLAMDFLASYCLPREMVVENCRELAYSIPPSLMESIKNMPNIVVAQPMAPPTPVTVGKKTDVVDAFQNVDSKVKAALTRAANSTNFKGSVALAKAKAVKKGGSSKDEVDEGGVGLGKMGADDDGGDEEEEENGNDNDEDDDGMVKMKTPKAKVKAKAKAKSAATTSANDGNDIPDAPKKRAAKAKPKATK